MPNTASKTASTVAAPDLASAMAHLMAIRAEINSRYIERGQEIDIFLTSLISRQHCLLLGAPGQGKSGIIDGIRKRITGAQLFKIQLMPDTDPQEIVGMLDIPAIKTGHYKHVTALRLPESHVVYLDETFNANSAVLKSLNGAMNEREFEDDGVLRNIPLVTLVGASNTMPQAEDKDAAALDALWDRFLLRIWVQDLSTAGRQQLFSAEMDRRQRRAQGEDTTGAVGTMISLAELEVLQHAVLEVAIPPQVYSTYFAIEREMDTRSMPKPSPRRMEWLQSVICANALLNGRTEAVEDDLLPLRHCLWQTKTQIREVAALVTMLAAPTIAKAQEVYDGIVDEIQKALVVGLKAQVKSQDPAVDQQNALAFTTKLVEVNSKLNHAVPALKSALNEATGAKRSTFEIEQMLADVQAKHKELLRLGGLQQPSWAQ